VQRTRLFNVDEQLKKIYVTWLITNKKNYCCTAVTVTCWHAGCCSPWIQHFTAC